jgi:parallel beta-helix repeat protein
MSMPRNVLHSIWAKAMEAMRMSDRKRHLGIIWVAMAVAAVHASPCYVAMDGKPEGDGSRERPWPSVEHALSQVGGGQTILVKAGIYRGSIQIAGQFAGTRERPTVIRSEVKWQAVIVGAEHHVISNGGGCDWVVIDGFEVMGGRYDGIKMNGDYNVVRNCWVHSNRAMGIAIHNRTGGVIENNLIEFNGGHVQFDHGIYASGEGLLVSGNVIRHNASYGLHLYPSIKDTRVVNNLVYGQVRRRGIIVACPQGGGRNSIVNNTVVEEQPLTIWNGNGETVANNILIAEQGEPFSFDERTQDVNVDYNLCVPMSARQGPHGLTGDPRFVDAMKGVFWLQADSPAIGKGSSQHAPAADFWGRPRPQDRAPDMGAFAFEPLLTGEEARADWDHGWAYHRHGTKAGLPDPWVLPAMQ